MSDSFRTIGVYVPPGIVDVLDEYVYAEAGVKDIREYFERGGSVPVGDPGAEVMAEFMSEIVESFDELYQRGAWEFARDVDADGFELVTLAAEPECMYEFREKVEAARTLKECDTRTVHTAIFEACVRDGLFDVDSVV